MWIPRVYLSGCTREAGIPQGVLGKPVYLRVCMGSMVGIPRVCMGSMVGIPRVYRGYEAHRGSHSLGEKRGK